MSFETFNLETSKPISMFSSLEIGLSALSKNLVPFFKMCFYPLLNVFAMLLMASPALFVFMGASFFGIMASVGLFFFGIALFFFSFWKSLLGFIAVSYLAKDIYENKPVQEPWVYYSYVEKFTFNYIKFNLWIFLFGVAASILYTAVVGFLVFAALFVKFFNLLSILGIVAVSAFFTSVIIYGFTFAYIFWAYGDKDDNLSVIKDAITLSFKNIFSVFLLFFITMTLIPTLLYAIILIPTGVLFGLKAAYATSSFLYLISMWFIYYFTMFITTRYYFALVKNK